MTVTLVTETRIQHFFIFPRVVHKTEGIGKLEEEEEEAEEEWVPTFTPI